MIRHICVDVTSESEYNGYGGEVTHVHEFSVEFLAVVAVAIRHPDFLGCFALGGGLNAGAGRRGCGRRGDGVALLGVGCADGASLNQPVNNLPDAPETHETRHPRVHSVFSQLAKNLCVL